MTCSTCGGRGWIEGVDHADECYAKGDCVDCGGVRVQLPCPDCSPEPS